MAFSSAILAKQSALSLALLLCISTVQAQSGDGGSAEGFSNSNLSGGDGADGNSNSSANLSKGAIIAIAVVVGLVVLGGVTLAVLFYLAKKRQWQIRQTIRRTTTKVVRAMTPRTPAKMNFGSPKSPGPSKQIFRERNKKARHGDVEKGFQSTDRQLLRSSEDSNKTKEKEQEPRSHTVQQHERTTSEADTGKKLPKPKPTISVPSSQFEIDSPKSPFLHRLFGRA